MKVKSTFNLPNFSNAKLLKGTTLPIKGNNMTLGLTANNSYAGLYVYKTGDIVYLAGLENAYGKTQGNTESTITGWVRTSNRVGITTDSAKSGVITDISSLNNINYYIKY